MLYIPVKSFNFNSLFATGSISPPAFYPERQFGMKSFDNLDFNHFNNSILLFDSIVRVEHKPVNANDFVFYISIPESQLDKRFLQEVDCGAYKSYLYSDTIYFEPGNISFIFNTEEDRQIAINDSKRNLKTKLVDHYQSSFKLISESVLSDIVSLQDLMEKDSVLCNESIKRDQQINKLKGFLYLFLYGWLESFPIELVKLEALTMELRNDINALLNDAAISSSGSSPSKNPIITKSLKHLDEKLEDFRSFIPEIEGLVDRLTTDHFVHTTGKTMPSSLKNLYDWINKFVSRQLPDSYEKAASLAGASLLINGFVEDIDRLLVLLKGEELGMKADFLSKQTKTIFSAFIDQIDSLKGKIRAKREYDLQTLYKVSDKGELLGIALECDFDKERYLILINSLIRDNSFNGINITNKRADLLDSLASWYKTAYGEDYFSKEDKKYLNNLYQLLKRKPSNFRIHDTNDLFLKSLATFLLNPEDLSKLDFLINNNQIKDKAIVFGIWGAILGFSALPRTIFEKIGRMLKTDEMTILDKLAIEKVRITIKAPYTTGLIGGTKPDVQEPEGPRTAKEEREKDPDKTHIPEKQEEEQTLTQKEAKSDQEPYIAEQPHKDFKERLIDIFKASNKPRTINEIMNLLPDQIKEQSLRKLVSSPPFTEGVMKKRAKTYKLEEADGNYQKPGQSGKQLEITDM
jgi:hypothetical protein